MTSDQNQRNPKGLGRGNIIFLGVQAVIICAAAGWAAVRVQHREAAEQLPPLRDKPIDVQPLYDYDFVVTDEQLKRVLHKLRPRFQGKETKIYHTDHNLRAWTSAAKFDGAEFMSGEQMLSLLTDHQSFAQVYGEDSEALLIDEGAGVRVRDKEGAKSTSHTDHTLACMAEVGIPLSYPIVTPNRRTTFRAILEQSLRDFSLNQEEYEWSALAYVLFVPPTSSWTTTEGQKVSFDILADRIMRESLTRGVCAANHRFHALVMFLRVDDMMQDEGNPPILSPQVRAHIIEYLQGVTAILVRNQHPDGFWNRNWPEGAPQSSEPTEEDGDNLGDRIIATGHVLEWWALAPQEILPPDRNVMIKAGQWLVKTIDDLTPQQVLDYQSFLSHSGRALALWRGRLPVEVDLRVENVPKEKDKDRGQDSGKDEKKGSEN
jgi:hypothetical protein